MKIRTRIAPSPTGFVHIGTIHNALFAHALAKSNNGDFILRVEDTDRKRFVEGAAESLYRTLDEFGLTPDEGPEQGGPFEPYIQSVRMESGIYKEAAEQMVKDGYAYYCFLTEEELHEMKGGQVSKKKGAFRSPWRDKLEEDVKAKLEDGDEYVIRLKVPDNEEIEIEDAILGKVKWNSDDVDDQVLLKSDGFPTYHLAVVVDDNAMKITHVTRAYEWLPSTPKQVLIYRYLGYELPIFAHSSLILDPEGGKLSKRKGSVAAHDFLEAGYLTEAIKNFLMLLGWSAPIERKHGEKEREIFSHQEFIDLYKLEDRHKTNAVFDRQKLLWFNQQYISVLSPDALLMKFTEWLKTYGGEDYKELEEKIIEKGPDYLEGILELIREKVKLLSEIPDQIKPFYYTLEDYDFAQIKQTKNLEQDQIKRIIEKYSSELDKQKSVKAWGHDNWEEFCRGLAEEMDLGAGKVFMVLRVAILRTPFSPPLFESMEVLEKDEVLDRMKNVKF